MKRNLKRKLWLDRRSIKIGKKRRRKYNRSYNSIKRSGKHSKVESVYTAIAPENFSFINNTDETAKYFADIIEQMDRKNYKQLFYIDSSKVVSVTTDALIYILAILYNIKLNCALKYSFKGNFPINSAAKAVYLESGFMNYVKSKRPKMPETDNRVQILSGFRTEPEIAGNVCDFVMNRFGKNRKFTFDLYKTLIELMSNTVHHAYNDKSKLKPYWYLYAVDLGESIQITFIDTGEGIPKTVKKKIFERLPNIITDSKLIYSAFLGEARTETGQDNRGNGLPALHEKVLSGKLDKFSVLSGTGRCKSIKEGDKISFVQEQYQREVLGTIFQFEIQNIKEEDAC